MVACSITEAEYRAMTLSVAKMIWLRSILVELKMNQGAQIKLWCDNKSAISITNNPVQHDRTKYVKIDRFFIKEKLNSGLLELRHVATREQMTDCLTKRLNSLDLIRLRDNTSLMNIFVNFKGKCWYLLDITSIDRY
jgi:hypothetical protein